MTDKNRTVKPEEMDDRELLIAAGCGAALAYMDMLAEKAEQGEGSQAAGLDEDIYDTVEAVSLVLRCMAAGRELLEVLRHSPAKAFAEFDASTDFKLGVLMDKYKKAAPTPKEQGEKTK